MSVRSTDDKVESALTGESVPVGKNVERGSEAAALHVRAAMLFKGTHAVRGSGEGVVVGTGLSTELGRITRLVDRTDEGTFPLEEQLVRLSHQLIWLTRDAAGRRVPKSMRLRSQPVALTTRDQAPGHFSQVPSSTANSRSSWPHWTRRAWPPGWPAATR